MLKKRNKGLVRPDTHQLRKFVAELWDVHQSGFTFLAAKKLAGWEEKSVDLQSVDSAVVDWLQSHSAEDYDLYFCPNAFSEPRRQSKYALSTPYAWCDIDGADPSRFDPRVSILWETSPGHTQALWAFTTKREPEYAEAVSKYLTYAYDGDLNGWSITKMLRLPGTINHKSEYNMPSVRLLESNSDPHLTWPKVTSAEALSSNTFVVPESGNAEAIITRYKRNIAPKYVSLMRSRRLNSSDRSRCIFMIVASLYNAGASKEDIAVVLQRSPYFIDKYGINHRALEKEIARITAKLDRERGGGDVCSP